MHGFTGGNIHGRNVQANGKPIKEYDDTFRAKTVMLLHNTLPACMFLQVLTFLLGNVT
jgi:hypothetical protein